MTNIFEGYPVFAWILRLGFAFLILSVLVGWGYRYRARRGIDNRQQKNEALDYLDGSYAKGEMSREEYIRTRDEVRSEYKTRGHKAS